jgi:hypothetical protein
MTNKASSSAAAPALPARRRYLDVCKSKSKRAPDTEFAAFETVQTDQAGNFADKVKVKKTRIYRAVVSETEVCDDETSNTQKVRVQKKKAAQEA